MRRPTRILMVLLSLCALALLGCNSQAQGHDSTATSPPPPALPFYGTPDFTPVWRPVAHAVQNFELWDQNGHRLTERSLQDKLTVVHFFFTSCGSVCPGLIRNLKQVQDSYGHDPDVQIYSLTVTPEEDSVEYLKEYATANELGDSWHLLTGSHNMIYALAKQSLFCQDEILHIPESGEFLHTERVFLIDGAGRIRGLYNGSLALEAERLVHDIERLKGAAPTAQMAHLDNGKGE